MEILSKKNNAGLVILFITSYIIRLLYCIKYPVPVRDALKYQAFILQWKMNNAIPLVSEDDLPPLYLYTVKELSTITNSDILKTGVALNIVLGCIIILLLARIGSILFEKKSYLIIGIVAATNPSFISFSCQMLRENLYLVGVSSYIFYLVKLFRRSDYYIIITLGGITTCTILARHEGFELLIMTLVSLCFIKHIKKKPIKVLLDYLIVYCTSIFLSFIILNLLMDVPFKYYEGYLFQLLKFLNKIGQ